MTSLEKISGRSFSRLVLGIVVVLPCASAVAAYMGLRDVLLGAFFAIGLSVFVAVLSGKGKYNDHLFVILVWSVGLSLLLSSTLASDYLRGYDVHLEYLRALQVTRQGLWTTERFDPYTSVLSVTVLAPMISILSALGMMQIFRFVFPLIYSLVPLILYKIVRKILAPGAAFLSVFLFMSYETFYDQMLSLGRQEIAESLLVLLVLVLLSPAISRSILGRLAILLLTVGLATSHYSFAYIYLILLAYSFIVSRMFRRRASLTLLLITSVIVLSWYAFVARGAGILSLNSAVMALFDAMTRELLSPSSRPAQLLKAFGLVRLLPGILHEVDRWTQVLVQLCLLLGFFVFVGKRQKSATEQEILPLMSVGFIFLVAIAAVPGFAVRLNVGRTYHIGLLFASTCFVYGAERLQLALRGAASHVKNLRHVGTRPRVEGRTRTRLLAATVLFLYFLFVSGWFWAVTSDVPTSFVLDSNRMANSADLVTIAQYFEDFTVLSDIDAAVWVHSYGANSRPVCADSTAKRHVLLSYGESYTRSTRFQTSYLPDNCQFSDSYVYLSEFNTLYGLGSTFGTSPPSFSISDISLELLGMNKVYSNGGAKIYA